jgi:hypothetical protein
LRREAEAVVRELRELGVETIDEVGLRPIIKRVVGVGDPRSVRRRIEDLVDLGYLRPRGLVYDVVAPVGVAIEGFVTEVEP